MGEYWERFASVYLYWEQLAHRIEDLHSDFLSLMEPGADRQEQAGIIT
jgi:hypothetical protein